jgi:hypothetical protein
MATADDCGAAAAAAAAAEAAAAEGAAAALQRWLPAAPCTESGPCCQQDSGTPAQTPSKNGCGLNSSHLLCLIRSFFLVQ